MPEQETAKVQRPAKTATGKVPATGVAKLVEWVKAHPAALLAVAGLFGVSGEELSGLLTYDLPGWALGVVVLLWAAIGWARDQLKAVQNLASNFEEMKHDVREVKNALADGTERFASHSAMLDKHEAELAAHRDALRMLAESRLDRN